MAKTRKEIERKLQEAIAAGDKIGIVTWSQELLALEGYKVSKPRGPKVPEGVLAIEEKMGKIFPQEYLPDRLEAGHLVLWVSHLADDTITWKVVAYRKFGNGTSKTDKGVRFLLEQGRPVNVMYPHKALEEQDKDQPKGKKQAKAK